MRPGEWVEAVFPEPIDADAVVVETSPGQWTARLQLEGRDPGGVWKLLAPAPQASDGPIPPDLRLRTAQELRRRGIGYLLSFENESDTADLRSHPQLYGLREVARNADARLYQLP
jgi:hypothetical protein